VVVLQQWVKLQQRSGAGYPVTLQTIQSGLIVVAIQIGLFLLGAFRFENKNRW
jgi:hypothetical protein